MRWRIFYRFIQTLAQPNDFLTQNRHFYVHTVQLASTCVDEKLNGVGGPKKPSHTDRNTSFLAHNLPESLFPIV